MPWKLEPVTGSVYNRKTRATEQVTMPDHSALYFPRSDAHTLAGLVARATRARLVWRYGK